MTAYLAEAVAITLIIAVYGGLLAGLLLLGRFTDRLLTERTGRRWLERRAARPR